jgi:hypothetical protein
MRIKARFPLAATLMALSAIPAAAGPVLNSQRVVAAVPEPYTLLLSGCALIGLGLFRRRRRITMNLAGGSK